MDRTGTTAVVTGGGRGFGKAFAEALAERGAHVVLIDTDGAAAAVAADGIASQGGSAVAFAGSVTDEPGMAAAMAQAAEVRGGIDLLVNNAGLHSDAYSSPIVDMGLEKVRRLFDVNVMGTVVCTLSALPYMRGRNGASVVNISSSSAYLGGSAYGTSKLAVGGLTLTFARELAADGIRVNAIAPGLILTDTIRDEMPAATLARIKGMQCIPADGAEQDIVEAMLWLTSAKARFVTGEVLRVTGGMAAGI